MEKIVYSFAPARMAPPAITFPADAPALLGMKACIARANAPLDFSESTARSDAFVSMEAPVITSMASVTVKRDTRVTIAS